jgi:hypothetical protein
MLMVGDVVDFAVVNYSYIPGMRPRCKKIRREANVVMVRVQVFDPPPQMDEGVYSCPKKRIYRSRPVWAPAKHLTAFLHEVPDKDNDPSRMNLVTVMRV